MQTLSRRFCVLLPLTAFLKSRATPLGIRLLRVCFVAITRSRCARLCACSGRRSIGTRIGSSSIPVKTGRRAMEKTLPEGIWSYLGQNAEANSIFNAAMLAKAQGQIPAIVGAGDFSRFNVIGDIAGGRGHLLRAILEAVPRSKGILFDLPHVVNEASELASERLTLQAGDFFKDPLPKCDVYILMEIIHDWPDNEAVAILQAVRRAANPGAALFLVETIVSADPGPDWSKMLDIHMLTLVGGKQRTLREYQTLLKQSDFVFQREIDSGAGISIIETLTKET
jgi:hypothetical protein